MSGFIDELRWRTMLFDMSSGVEEQLAKGMQTGYIGFDPTAESLTIGNYVQIRVLQLFQKHGHRPIALMGGATGRIGDPSGKDAERQLLSFDELDKNLQFQETQLRKFLNFEEGDNNAILENNYRFYSDMNALDFLRDVGKRITINYMMSKDSVKTRLETGLSFTEFSYQLIQGYDFVCLNREHSCCFQMGGSDQWGNITTGSDMVRRMTEDKAFAVTTPLLTKSDGTKFGKSSKGNVWLSAELTSPYKFYQYWLNSVDADIEKYLLYFSDRPKDEIFQAIEDLKTDPRRVKQEFAYEITSAVHSIEHADAAVEVSQRIFGRATTKDELCKIDERTFLEIADEIDSETISRSDLLSDSSLISLLANHTKICSSNGEARRALQNNSVSINKRKVQLNEIVNFEDEFIHGKYFMLEQGKKNKYIIIVE